MNLEKVIFGFFIIFACTLNFGFFIGDIERPELHHPMELLAAVVVNLVATVLKFGDRTQLGATHLSTSLVASFQLIAGVAGLGLATVRRRSADDRPHHLGRRVAFGRCAAGQRVFRHPADRRDAEAREVALRSGG
jgi:hypothetical protein